MPIGVEIQLFDGASPLANLTGVQALWWDVESPLEMQRPIGKTAGANTDANGFLRLDLSNVTGLEVGASGYLILYKPDVSDHKASPTFQGKVTTSNVASGVDMYYYDSGWVRPADWLSLPAVTESDQKFVGLHAVYPENANFVALSANGAYTVDWGDGTTTNYAAGVVAQRNIDYNAAVLVGSECSRGYRQAIITVTPQSGQSLTSMSLAAKHSQTGLQAYATGWLDCAVSLHETGALSLYLSTIGHLRLEQFKLLTNSTTDFSNMFSGCSSLQSVPLLNTAAGTNFSNMFNNCSSLRSIPLLDTAAGTNFGSMFNNCSSLQSIPLLNTAGGTNFSSMFNSCSSLRSIPLLNTAAGTNFSSMLAYCSSLESIPLLNTVAGTDFSNMFNTCSSLWSIPLLDTAAGTNFGSMFGNCSSLQSIPLLNTVAGTVFSNMFGGCRSLRSIPLLNTAAGTVFNNMLAYCSSLQSVPLLNTAGGTNFSSMFNSCSSLRSIPLLNTAAGTNFGSMFASCRSLQSVPLLNTAAGTTFSNMFNSCSSLEKGALSGTGQSISYSGCKLSAAELDGIYTSLATVTSKTITVTNNWGTAADTPSIATAKGWTVTG